MEVVIFGAGRWGIEAYRACELRGDKVIYFLDNDSKLWGKEKFSTPIISLERYMKDKMNYPIIIAAQYKNAKDIENQLWAAGIEQFRVFDSTELFELKGRLVSYCSSKDKEDVILYHLFKDEKDIFYIDIGSMDPYNGNVTKLLYDVLEARGINIEPQEALAELTKVDRPRDITLCLGCGDVEATAELHTQDGGSTLVEEHAILRNAKKSTIKIVPLRSICDEYLKPDQKISFLKIDVEGFEEKVLLGADFDKYRPEVILIESTLPRTDIPCYDKWEYILTRNNYKFAFECGINRYYVAAEKEDKFKDKYMDIPMLNQMYTIYRMGMSLVTE